MQELALLWVQRERADAAPPRQTARGILQDKPLLAKSTVMVITFSTQNCAQAGSQSTRPLPHMNLNVS